MNTIGFEEFNELLVRLSQSLPIQTYQLTQTWMAQKPGCCYRFQR